MREPLRVAVIGCGTAGAASALFLARAGHVSSFRVQPTVCGSLVDLRELIADALDASMAGTKTGLLWGTRETRMPRALP